jgi:hypothetical protein
MKSLPMPGPTRTGAPARSTTKQKPDVEHPLAAFWPELVEAVGHDFNGSVVLHCAGGAVQKYEVHIVGRPRGGAVVVQRSRPA